MVTKVRNGVKFSTRFDNLKIFDPKKNGRSQLKKMNFFLVSQVKVVLDVIEGEEFTYRYQNDVSARQSRKIEPLFSKKRPYFGLTYHPEEVIF